MDLMLLVLFLVVTLWDRQQLHFGLGSRQLVIRELLLVRFFSALEQTFTNVEGDVCLGDIAIVLFSLMDVSLLLRDSILGRLVVELVVVDPPRNVLVIHFLHSLLEEGALSVSEALLIFVLDNHVGICLPIFEELLKDLLLLLLPQIIDLL